VPSPQTVRVAAVIAVVAGLGVAFWHFAPRKGDAVAPAPAVTAAAGDASANAARAALPPIAFAIIPTIDDRFVQEPCNRVPGGGFSSLAAVHAEIEEHFPDSVGLSMGDLTGAWGGIAAHTSSFLYSEVYSLTGIQCVGAGEGELGLGVGYVREVLTRTAGVKFLCANAADDAGEPIMSGSALFKSGQRGLLVVGVAAESLEPELRRRGSTVQLLASEAGARQALTQGLAHAPDVGVVVDVKVLLVHGTVDEAAAILEKVPGFTFAVAAHGGILADPKPRRVGAVPIFYGGRGARFAWRVLSTGGDLQADQMSLARIGVQELSKGSPYVKALEMFRDMATKSFFEQSAREKGGRIPDPRGAYVGAGKCAECHADIAAMHAASPHGTPLAAYLKSSFAASTGCMPCHVTAPYWDSGWKGPKDTSDMAAISCEACHGPGSAHVAAPKKGWGAAGLARCYDCHLPDRSPEFDAASAWKTVGHGPKR
jgi:hypothetical protein